MFSIFSRRKAPEPLFFHTDIHCHIIPGVDDGSPDLDTSLQLAWRMSHWGLTRVIATPHMTQDTFENTDATLDPPLHALQEALEGCDSTLQVTRSAEHRLDDYFMQELNAGRLRPFPGNYLLVENSFMQEPWGLDQIIFDLKLRGYKPIMAHPERFEYYQNNPMRYEQLYRNGNLLQINLLSLAGYYGKRTRETAERLLEQGFVSFIGTDLHSHRHADAIDEYLSSKAYRRLLNNPPRLLNDIAFGQ